MNGTALKILIADDDAGDRKLIKRAIQQGGLECRCAETVSTEQALEMCGHSEFDCVIVDYRLPGEDGLAGISAMHARYPLLPIIMSTGQGDELVAADAIKRGASDYIPKADVNALTMRKMIENTMEKAALRRKVKQQADDLQNFARILVHDLRSPILSIMGFAHLVQEELCDGHKDAAIECSDRVIKATERMTRLIDTLRQYNHAGAQVAFVRVDMNAVLVETLANLDSLLHSSGTVVTADPLPSVMGDAPQLSQLLQNLIENGTKYCEEPVARIHIAAARAQDTWLFSVSDNGIGIPKEHFRKVFEPLKRLNGASKCEGTGLGLATCERIVERHGGRIWCESNEGQGTTFQFTLGAADAAIANPE
jgi:hypothetical protein